MTTIFIMRSTGTEGRRVRTKQPWAKGLEDKAEDGQRDEQQQEQPQGDLGPLGEGGGRRLVAR